jgi:NADPH2 dehydrogenase
MADPGWARVATLRSPEAFRRHLGAGGIPLAFDDALATPSNSPFARPLEADGLRAGNRWCVLPMEGWDGTADGHPTELTRRRWRNFGLSGAKLVWGGEAAAVRHDGRANPCQLVIGPATWESLARLRDDLVAAHESSFGKGAANDLVVGLQITHSGRYARPSAWDRPEPLVAFAHPVLDRRFPGGVRILTDEELDRLADDYVGAAVLARRAGFQFVDVKHCHGYLGHELLGAHERPGRYGGSLENRTRLLRTIVEGIRAEAPGLRIGVRFSAFDTVPWRKSESGRGEPERSDEGYRSAFGLLRDERMDEALGESRALLRLLQGLGIRWTCVSAGSPYYNPHVQRPALFPPSDGYRPPEDPLAGVARQIHATALLKKDFPDMVLVGSAYSYLQEWLPNVGQRVVREGQADFVGLGRMVLSYPELPADVLAGRPLARKRICRTFSDCTTAPRKGLPSGCYPLDPFYAARPEAGRLKAVKEAPRA